MTVGPWTHAARDRGVVHLVKRVRNVGVQVKFRSICLLVGAVLLASCTPTTMAAPREGVVIASGGSMGVYYGYANALAASMRRADPELPVEVITTAGSRENLALLAQNAASCAFVATDAAAEAIAASTTSPGAEELSIASVARVYDDYLHLVARADGPVRTVGDLADRRVSLGPPTSGTRLIVDRLFESSGGRPSMTVMELGIDDSLDALEAGTMDAFFWSGGVPTTGVGDLSERLPLRIVPLDELATDLTDAYATYRAATIPIGPYGNPQSVATIAVPNQLVCRSDLDPAVVEFIVDRLFAGRDDIALTVPQARALDRRFAIETNPVPLHPAALEWYRSSKP